jgi:hypothetical protein
MTHEPPQRSSSTAERIAGEGALREGGVVQSPPMVVRTNDALSWSTGPNAVHCVPYTGRTDMTTTKRLEKTVWKTYFDSVSKILDGKHAEIEVAALNIGSQIAAEWLPVIGITYDQHSDLIAVMAEGLDHMIRKPREVFIESAGVDLLSMEVIDSDGISCIVRFREPLLLPAP